MPAHEDRESLHFALDVMSYMTLEEKLGQLDLFHPSDDPALEQAIVAGRVGGVVGGAHGLRWQGLSTSRSRLGVPLLLVDRNAAAALSPSALAPSALSPSALSPSTLSPSLLSPWALAASWDEDLACVVGADTARDALALGCNAFDGPRLHTAAAATPSAQLHTMIASEPQLLAQLASGFCRGATQAWRESQSAALPMARCIGGGEQARRAMALAMIHDGRVPAIDCDALDHEAARLAGFDGIPLAECARIRAIVDEAFATTSARSRIEAAERALEQGLLDERALDAAVRGVLSVKHRLGLFRHPQRMLPGIDSTRGLATPGERVRATMVLLRNEAGILPLSPVSDRVLVIGPPEGAARECAEALTRAGIGHTTAPGLALRQPGQSWTEPLPGDYFAQALTRDAASRADFAMVVLDDRHFVPAGPPAKGEAEGDDNGGWPVPGDAALSLLKALAGGGGSRLVGLLATSGPVALGEADPLFAALLQCWAPAEGLAEALGDILSGRFSPQGRMPVSAGRFAFGHGLGFGETVFSGFTLQTVSDHLAASVKLRNAGCFTARETVQVYVRGEDKEDIGKPRLAAFRHIMLQPGEEAAMTFQLGLEALGSPGASGRLELAPGRFQIALGKDRGRLLSASVEISAALARAMARRGRRFLRLAG